MKINYANFLPADYSTLSPEFQAVAKAKAIKARKAEIRLQAKAAVAKRRETRLAKANEAILQAKKASDRLEKVIARNEAILAKAKV